MTAVARIVLNCAAALIALGGLYDLLVPQLPPNVAGLCGDNPHSCKLVRELLRALGGALLAIGLTVAILVNTPAIQDHHQTLIAILFLVLPSEGINSIAMYRAGSPFYIPLSFLLIALSGVFLAW